MKKNIIFNGEVSPFEGELIINSKPVVVTSEGIVINGKLIPIHGDIEVKGEKLSLSGNQLTGKKMSINETIFVGKTKFVVQTADPDHLELFFTDVVTINNQGVEDPGGNEAGHIVEGAGKACLLMTKHFFEEAIKMGIPTHLVDVQEEFLQMTVKKAKNIGKNGLEFVFRFNAAGSALTKYPSKRMWDNMTEEGNAFIEITEKNDAAGDPLITGEEIISKGWLSEEQLSTLKEWTIMLAKNTYDFFRSKKEGAKTPYYEIDGKWEFGFDKDGNLMLIDEYGPGSTRVIKVLNKNEIGAMFL